MDDDAAEGSRHLPRDAAERGLRRSRVEAQNASRAARWSDILLPSDEVAVLQEIAALVAPLSSDYEEPDARGKRDRALGIGVLFSGEDGKGKTLASEVLAEEVHRPLYRVDVSRAVSKYIGETEKNLKRVFDRAEGTGAILVLDEADALFGKRSEAGDNRDADIAVAYLLQRIENHRGLAILNARRRSALDAAFIRRLRFVIDFPLPTSAPTDDRAPTR